jgi:hypothetical protein
MRVTDANTAAQGGTSLSKNIGRALKEDKETNNSVNKQYKIKI